ncbi:MAG: GTP 3',8-cyclase MoaA [Dehalococcoidia bacterium]|nr:GTP 3',8-cyclase MoaA [Dehalococcoidia bacterium]
MIAASPRPSLAPLVDRFGRTMTSLRVSVTDRCNFRCTYCMPEDGLPWLPGAEILTFDEIERLVRLFVRLGITEVRLTGGEPTLRAHLPTLIERLAAIEGLEDLSLTTNGFSLKRMASRLAAAGLRRINVSLDSLDPSRFAALTRRPALDRVLEGLYEAEKYPQLWPIKVNAVTMPGMSDDDILDFCELARNRHYIVRFLEYMPLDAEGNWDMSLVMPGAQTRAIIEKYYRLEPMDHQYGSTSQRWRFADGSGEIGFINPVTEPFCAECNRLRLTADGMLRTCLFSTGDWDLKGPMRAGATDDDLTAIIREAVSHKEKKHRINEGKAFLKLNRSMSQIGG